MNPTSDADAINLALRDLMVALLTRAIVIGKYPMVAADLGSDYRFKNPVSKKDEVVLGRNEDSEAGAVGRFSFSQVPVGNNQIALETQYHSSKTFVMTFRSSPLPLHPGRTQV